VKTEFSEIFTHSHFAVGILGQTALNASMRSKAGSIASSKKYPPESIGPPGTSYSLWSATHSLKREHKRKFNRSLCGVLLGVSIVLVILGILGIIGIAVYLGGEVSAIKF
jgi:hypothetical protein